MLDQLASSVEFFKAAWTQLGLILPKIIVASVVLVAGWLAARLLRKLLLKLMKWVHLDVAAEKVGIENFLLQGGVEYTAVTLVANTVYWLLMFAIMLAVANVLGLQSTDALFTKVILYVPQVIVAVLVLVFGALLAKFFRGITYTYLSNIGISGAEFISHLAQWALLLFVVSIALEQLSIGGQILVSTFQIAFGALCLALALAFGLGGREWAAHILERLWKKQGRP
jgi:hypothetical protein